ncbi:MAG: hypothetical protein QG601_2092, partial [Pseudomonadota bacterium]|nr:hypothetical protein [Pseudomonadota bacterium]
MWQAVVVGLIVLAAATYAAWALLPATLRLRLARHLAATARRSRAPEWLVRFADAIAGSALRRLGGCSDCSAVQAAP